MKSITAQLRQEFPRTPNQSIFETFKKYQQAREIPNTAEQDVRLTPMVQEEGLNTLSDQVLSGILEKTLLTEVFFHVQNIRVIHNNIRFQVYQKTKEIIGEQSKRDLVVIMRSIFLDHAKHLPTNITQQVQELNQRVSDECARIIVANMQEYARMKTAFQVRAPLPMPENVSSAGSKMTRKPEMDMHAFRTTGTLGGATF